MARPRTRLGHHGPMIATPSPGPHTARRRRWGGSARRRPSGGSARAVVVLALVLALAGLGSACSSTASSGSKSGSSTSSSSAPTTAVGGGTTTTALPIPPSTPISIPVAADGVSPNGSGCTPPSETKLPDGIWFGVLKSADPATNTVGLDLACYYTGSAAQAAAGSSTPVPNDAFIRNQSSNVYPIPAVPDVAVVPLAQAANGALSGGLAPAQKGVAAAQAILAGPTQKLVWIQITRGVATVIQAQFTP